MHTCVFVCVYVSDIAHEDVSRALQERLGGSCGAADGAQPPR